MSLLVAGIDFLTNIYAPTMHPKIFWPSPEILGLFGPNICTKFEKKIEWYVKSRNW
jgi:hypothetical protein